MIDKVINILILEEDEQELRELLDILQNPGHNIFRARNEEEVLDIISKRDIAILICDLDMENLDGSVLVNRLNSRAETMNTDIIVTSRDLEKVYAVINGLNKGGAVDYLIKPWLPYLVQARIGVYKKLFFKRQRITRLLENILPTRTLMEFREYGKSSPKKHLQATVLFSDFVKFTEKTRNMDPNELIQKLDYYFSHFDEIMLKYGLEKIKTIGDAYMAVGGVTEHEPFTALRTALAALEMQNFIENDILTSKALGKDFWELRVGIHTGNLVAGVVGKHKFSFDVWGDTVNVAARCEQNSEAGKTSISVDFHDMIMEEFNCTHRGFISIKNRGELEMYFMEGLKPEYSMYGEGRIPNAEIRKKIGLPAADFDGLRSMILNKMKAELSDDLIYHSYEHTLDVEQAVLRYAELEGLSEEEIFLVRTAALFHDTGFLLKYHDNELIGAQLAQKYLPMFGYSTEDVQTIGEIILSTSYEIEPKNQMERVMSDADHDYLGRADYHHVFKKLLKELEYHGKKLNEREQLEVQIEYLSNKHQYYTTTALNLRQPGKENRITELKARLAELLISSPST